MTFGEQRTRPSYDLTQRVPVSEPKTIIDLGCGPGNSANVCALRWPDAKIVGLDSSQEMIEAARRAYPQREWQLASIDEWAATDAERFDVVFSNAALQWVPKHDLLFPRLFSRVAPGGALAVQMPGNYHSNPHRIAREMAASERWRRWFHTGRAREWFVHEVDFYYSALAPVAAQMDIWTTEYIHVMQDVNGIVQWYKSTGLRPYLDAITDEPERERFLDEYRERLQPHFPASPAGGVLFPFRRIFIVAARATE